MSSAARESAAETRVFPLRLEARHDGPTDRIADPRLIAQVDLNLKHMLTGGQHSSGQGAPERQAPSDDPTQLTHAAKRPSRHRVSSLTLPLTGATPAGACRPTTMSKLPRWKRLPVSGVIVRPAVDTGSPKMKSSMTTTWRSPVSSGPGAALPLMMRTRATSSPDERGAEERKRFRSWGGRHETFPNQAAVRCIEFHLGASSDCRHP